MVRRIELFGHFRVFGSDGAPVPLPSLKAATLLARLAIQPGEEISRERMADALWPDAPPEAGRARLRTLLSEVRDALGTDADAIRVNRNHLRLDPAVETDVARFRALVSTAETTDGEAACRHLEEAGKLYAGDLLPDLYADWVVREREALGVEYVRSQRRLAACHEACGRYAPALAAAERAIQQDPLCEEAYGDAIRIHIAAGQTTAAHRQYLRLKQTLQREMDAVPSSWVDALLATIPPQTPPQLPQPSTEPRTPTSVAATDPVSTQRVAPSLLHPALFWPFLVLAGLTAFGSQLQRFWKLRATPVPQHRLLQAWHYPTADEEKDSQATALAFDTAGNLIVVGFVQVQNRDVDFLILKISPDGRLLWKDTYDGPAHDVDRATHVQVDAAGNVYVAGESDNGRGNGATKLAGLDVVVVKYAPDGRKEWVHRFDGPDNGEDRVADLVWEARRHTLVVLARELARGKKGDVLAGYEAIDIDQNGEVGTRMVHDPRIEPYEITPVAIRDALDFDRYVGGILYRGEGADPDAVLVKYTERGRRLWTRRFGAGNDAGDGLVGLWVDTGEFVHLVGYTGAPVRKGGRAGMLTALYRDTGILEWASTGTDSNDYILQPLGYWENTLVGSVPTGEGRDLIRVIRREGDGRTRWTCDLLPRTRGPFAGEIGVTWSPGEATYVSATVDGARGGPDLFVSCIDAMGKVLWAETYDTGHDFDRTSRGIAYHHASGPGNGSRLAVAFQSSGGRCPHLVVLWYRA